MTKQKYLFNAVAAALIAVFAAPVYSAINRKDDGLKGKSVGIPVQVLKDGKVVWDICVPTSGMKCDSSGRSVIAKSAEQEACEASPDLCDLTKPLAGRMHLANLDPKGGESEVPRVAIQGIGSPRIIFVCKEGDEGCVPGQQMGGDIFEDEDKKIGCNATDENCVPGQQMGGDDHAKKDKKSASKRKKFKERLSELQKKFSW